MKKLELWRRQARDGLPLEAPNRVEEEPVAAVGEPLQSARPADTVDDTLNALRRAAMLQHEDTVPAAFYRAPAD